MLCPVLIEWQQRVRRNMRHIEENYTTFTACYSKCKFTDNTATSAGGIVGGKANHVQDNGLPNFSACYWNGTNVSRGVGYADSAPKDVMQGMDWRMAATTMNVVLGSNFGYQYEHNGFSTELPVLIKKQ